MLKSVNPYNGQLIKEYEEETTQTINHKLDKAQSTFKTWSKTSLKERADLLNKLAEVLDSEKQSMAEIVALEVGQPVKSVIGEVEKCALTARYHAENLEEFLQPTKVQTEFQESYVSYEPLGVILGISPWNFPYWMAFRVIIPTVASGNTVVLKHSSNVSGSSLKIQEVMLKAGFSEGVLQSLILSSKGIDKVILDPRIAAVSFAGSDNAGMKVLTTASIEIKKVLLELGGSDPFIVFNDADVDSTAKALADARFRNAGQACNSPKRVLVQSGLYDSFKEKVLEYTAAIKVGDPMDSATVMGPISTLSGLETVEAQIEDSVRKGATILIGGSRIENAGTAFEATVVENVQPGMLLFDEEVFGPVIALTKFESKEEAVELANNTKYGLGASVWTKDLDLAKELIPQLNTGNVFVNQPVRSDPRLPYGGTKASGLGRELGEFGIKEFVNIKTVVIK